MEQKYSENTIINHLLKNRKIDKIKCKKHTKTAKIGYKTIKTTQIDAKMQKISQFRVDIFSMAKIYSNMHCLSGLSKYSANKINSQINSFRSVKGTTLVEFSAKEIIKACFWGDVYNIDKYIVYNNYNILYKKELQVLPYLLLNEIFSAICNIANKIKHVDSEISAGAGLNRFNNWQQFSLAKIYGIAKYNPNLLKYIEISNVNIKKCVFAFITKLNLYQNKISLLLKMVDNILPYTSFSKSKL